jgi:hypothetical protein
LVVSLDLCLASPASAFLINHNSRHVRSIEQAAAGAQRAHSSGSYKKRTRK